MLINDNIYIPNVISPNSQTGNDIFTVFGPSIELIEILSVYDRWGNQVYFQNNEITGWNGKIKDQDAATGVYVYYALVKLVDGTQRVLSGDFTLLR